MNLSKIPILDLHGEISKMVYPLVNVFIKDNMLINQKIIKVVHGTSSNILKDELKIVLNENKHVLKHHLNKDNLGETIVYLK